jgi:O-antigen/teichoic acid export membrane protein
MASLKFIKSSAGLAFSQSVVQVTSFLRNVFLARLISPADFGIGATFVLTVSFLDMMSSMAADRLLIQAEDGNEPKFQHTVQAVNSWRGVMNGAMIFLLAGPISQLFSVPQALWAFRCLALVPFIKGFNHEDTNRLQREMKYRPIIMVETMTSILVTILAVVLGLWLRSYAVMLWLAVSQVLITMLVSHLVAERPFQWELDRLYARRIFTFGWPLLVNGLLLYVIFQGDRFVIGSAPRLFPASNLKLADLGIYSVAFSLTMAPTMMIANVATSLFLPLLSRVQNSPKDFERRYVACARTVSLLAAMVSIPVIVGGHWIILFIYGGKYEAAGTFIGWLAAMWAVRIIRVTPTLASMAKSDTRNMMASNVVRSLALLAVISIVALGYSLVWVAACGFIGEVLATIFSVMSLRRRHGVPLGIYLKPAFVCLFGMGIAALVNISGVSQTGWLVALIATSSIMVMVILLMLQMFPEFRREVWGMVSRSESSIIAKKDLVVPL